MEEALIRCYVGKEAYQEVQGRQGLKSRLACQLEVSVRVGCSSLVNVVESGL
jgi:hypothetical protein